MNDNIYIHSYENTQYLCSNNSYSYKNISYKYRNDGDSFSYNTITYKYSKNNNKNQEHRKTYKNTDVQKFPDEFRLIQKIFKFLENNEKTIIKSIINNCNKHYIELYDALLQISNIITPIMIIKNIKRDEDRQNWIANQIVKYIKNDLKINPTNEMRIVDIGGGNGNVLREINSVIKNKYGIETSPDNFICVETESDWVENYKFDNEYIKYSFWDNKNISIESNTADIVLCMVSLHHMNNETIEITLSEINRILKSGGYVLIKEHDASSQEVIRFIEWEHYLYHVLDNGYNNKIVNPSEFMSQNIDNFKSKNTWRYLLELNGFRYIETISRGLEKEKPIYDTNNITNLYWEIYQK